MRRVGVLVAATALLLGACSSSSDDHDDGHEEEGKPTGATCPTDQTLTYENFGRDFMETYCLSCHGAAVTGDARQGAPSDHNFDTIDEVRGFADHIDQYAGAGPNAVNEEMPDADPVPTEDERRQLSEWLACGAP
jgi:uncharacterized membrane protein